MDRTWYRLHLLSSLHPFRLTTSDIPNRLFFLCKSRCMTHVPYGQREKLLFRPNTLERCTPLFMWLLRLNFSGVRMTGRWHTLSIRDVTPRVIFFPGSCVHLQSDGQPPKSKFDMNVTMSMRLFETRCQEDLASILRHKWYSIVNKVHVSWLAESCTWHEGVKRSVARLYPIDNYV